jgi:hypothetical protein
MNTPEQREAFAKMVVEMRRDAIGEEVVDVTDVQIVILGAGSRQSQG